MLSATIGRGALIALFFTACSHSAQSAPATTSKIAGVYEIGVGTKDAQATINYWTEFGYRVDRKGSLTPQKAKALYGVDSSLTAIRLAHQDADHGLIRVMAWDRPTNQGLNMRKMRVIGNRWTAILTADVLSIANHGEIEKRAGKPIHLLGPMWDVIYQDENAKPFFSDPVGVRELMMLRPQSRQFLFQRYGYQIPNYGKVNSKARMKTSQVTHVGLILHADDNRLLNFYEDTLGLLRIKETEGVSTYEGSITGRQIFDIRPGEAYYSTNFDDPRSSREFMKARSGRLKIIRYPKSLKVEQAMQHANPGALGYSLYTYRVNDIAAFHQKVKKSKATGVTDVHLNEFGEKSFSFVAPDGYFWTLVEGNLAS